MPSTSPTSTPLTPETTLAAIALRSDAHATVLDRYKLDFCCRGGRSLVEACRTSGLDVERLLAELATESAARKEATDGDVDWHRRPVDELIDFIEGTHHTYTRTAIERLTGLLTKVAGKHSCRHPELGRLRSVFEELAEDLEPHMMKEEHVLFPYIRALASPEGAPPPPFGTVRNPVRVMTREHDRAGELLAAITDVTAKFSPPGDACASFRALYAGLAELRQDLMRHVALENHVLFPRAVALEEGRQAPRG